MIKVLKKIELNHKLCPSSATKDLWMIWRWGTVFWPSLPFRIVVGTTLRGSSCMLLWGPKQKIKAIKTHHRFSQGASYHCWGNASLLFFPQWQTINKSRNDLGHSSPVVKITAKPKVISDLLGDSFRILQSACDKRPGIFPARER